MIGPASVWMGRPGLLILVKVSNLILSGYGSLKKGRVIGKRMLSIMMMNEIIANEGPYKVYEEIS
jgi:hypothetical protein